MARLVGEGHNRNVLDGRGRKAVDLSVLPPGTVNGNLLEARAAAKDAIVLLEDTLYVSLPLSPLISSPLLSSLTLFALY